MFPDWLDGVIANVFTVFHDDGAFDEDGQRRFLDALAARGGISAYFVRSGMGQMYAYDADDVRRMVALACAHLGGHAPVLAGTSGIWDRDRDRRPDPEAYTREAAALSRYAAEQGAAATVLTMPDAFAAADVAEATRRTREYLEAVSAAAGIPVLLYQPPGTDPLFEVTPESIRTYAGIPGVSGIKVSTADAGYMLDLCWATRDLDFAYITGNETAFYAGLCMGSTAVIGQGACINPQVLGAVQQRFHAGDHGGAMEAQYAVNRLVRGIPNPVWFFKTYLAEQGYAMGATSRREPGQAPAAPLSPERYAQAKRLLEEELARYL